MAAPRPLRARPYLGALIRLYESRFTTRGRYALWATAAFALIGVDTRRTQVFTLFAVGFALLVAASVFARVHRVKLSLVGRLPARMTASQPLSLPLRLENESGRAVEDVVIRLPTPADSENAPSLSARETYAAVEPGRPIDVSLELIASRRGRYQLSGVTAATTDPLRLVAVRSGRIPDENVIVYPRYFTVEELDIPLGRRYQPGGIPLTSSTGDAIEFVGTRDYRDGDPIRNIHWRSWARRGQPVVKEYQQEYFCRIALILDTFLPRDSSPEDLETFEAGISVLASVADYFSRGELVVDILAAGPDVYEVSAGRSLAYLDNILDVLACLEPCYEPPFARIGPYLFDKLAQLTTVIAILHDWDEPREEFLAQVRSQGTSVRAFVVRDGRTAKPLPTDDELGEVSRLSPAQVAEAIASTGAIRLSSSGPTGGGVRV